MTAKEVAAHFGAKKAGKGRWTARCPAHDDRSKNTLSIKEGNTAILVHCWAGCDKRDVLSRVGLRMRDLFYNSRDVPSEKLKEIRRQQAMDTLYRQEQRRQALKMWLRSLECKWKPVRVKTEFERLIERAYVQC